MIVSRLVSDGRYVSDKIDDVVNIKTIHPAPMPGPAARQEGETDTPISAVF